MEITTLIDGGKIIGTGILMIIGGASLILRFMAPKTKTLLDDKAYKFLEKCLKFLSAAENNMKDININVKK